MALTVRSTSDFALGPLSPLFSVPGLSFLGVSRRKSPYNGEQWVLTYESAASNDPTIASAAEEGYLLVPSDFSADLQALGPTYRLTVTTPDIPSGGTAGVQQTFFELNGNALQKDIREHPKALVLGPSRIEAISRAVDRWTNAVGYTYSIADVTGATEEDEAITGDEAADALSLYNLLRQRNGNAAFQISQYVFRYTRIASNRASLDVGYSNVEKILTTEQMVAETGPPVGILSAIADAVTAATPTTVASGYQFGWLKQTPTVTNIAGNKIQISGEYWLESWSTWLYAVAA